MVTRNSSNSCIKTTTSNEVTAPLQPAFFCKATATVLDVTGDGTEYTFITATEIKDQNSDFDGTSTFTAPITGEYNLQAHTYSVVAAGHTTAYLKIKTSNRTYYAFIINPGAIRSVYNTFGFSCTKICDMDASDTATVSVTVSGSTKVVDLFAGADASPSTIFSGYLIC